MALEQMLNLIKASFLLFFIFFNSLVSTQESILPGEPQVAEIVKKIPQSIERLRRKRKLDRYLWNKRLKKIQDTITSVLSTVGLISIGYLIYNKLSPETSSGGSLASSGGFFFNNNKEEEVYSPGTKTVKTSFRCLLFAVANSLSWEPDFVWPEAGIADDEAGKKLDRIEKARRIVRFLDVEFKKYAENYNNVEMKKEMKKEANGSFVSSDNFNRFFYDKFPEIAKKHSYLIVHKAQLSYKFGFPFFLLLIKHLNNQDLSKRGLNIPENKYTNIIEDKFLTIGKEVRISESKEECFSPNYSGCYILGEQNMFKNKSIIVGDGSHYVCVHFDGEKLIQCNNMAPSNPKVWSSIKNDLEKFFGVN